MTKFLIIALIVIAAGIGFVFITSNNSLKESATVPSVTQNNGTLSKAPSPSASVADTSDNAIEDDLNALDKELAEIDKSEAEFQGDLQGL